VSPESRAYFDAERRISLDPDDPRHILPVFPPNAAVLCVGCGGGWDGESVGTRRFVGVDINPEAIAYRHERDPANECYVARGEALPLEDESFSFCMARVSVMYMHMPAFFREAHRVLESDGVLWFTCHRFAHTASHALRSVRHGAVKDVLFRGYVALNGLLFHLTGRHMHSSSVPRLNESFQTKTGLRRALARAGFVDVQFPRTRHGQFLVTARKP
jgi:SAM-dependent methyltransferase